MQMKDADVRNVASSESGRTEKDVDTLWHVSLIIRGKKRDGIWLYEVVYEESTLAWE